MLAIDDLAQLQNMDRTGRFGRAADLSGRVTASARTARGVETRLPSAQSVPGGPVWLWMDGIWAGIGKAVAALPLHPTQAVPRPLFWAGDLPETARPDLPGFHLDLRGQLPPDLHPAQAFLALLLLLDSQGIRPFPPKERRASWSIHPWLPTEPMETNAAKGLAQRCITRVPLFWAGPEMAGVAQVWQRRYQEYAEAAAFWATAGEMAESQIMARFPRFWNQAGFAVHLLPAQVSAAYRGLTDGMKVLFAHRSMQLASVTAQPTDPVQAVWYLLEFGEWVALYAAALNEVDPADQVPRQFLDGLG